MIKHPVKLIIFLFFLSLFIPAIVHAGPQLPALDRGPAVYDFASMVDSGMESQIDTMIKSIESKTSAEIAVVTITSLEDDPIEDYSVRLFEKAGIGKKEKDNGVLLLVAKEERKIWITTGYGVEGVLPDGECGRITREVISPQFKKGNYSQGIYDGVSAIGDDLNKDKTAGKKTTKTSLGTGGAVIGCLAVAIAIFVIFLVIYFIRRSRQCPKCGSQLKITTDILEEATYLSSGRKIVTRDCPKCGYHDENEETIPMLEDTSDSSSSSSSGSDSGGSFGGGESGGGGGGGDW